jgi:hypothetical protein
VTEQKEARATSRYEIVVKCMMEWGRGVVGIKPPQPDLYVASTAYLR